MEDNNIKGVDRRLLGMVLVAVALLVAGRGAWYWREAGVLSSQEMKPEDATSPLPPTPPLPPPPQAPSAAEPKEQKKETTSVPPAPKEDPQASLEKKTLYADGTYTQNGPYSSPAGKEDMKVTLTLKDDVITAASGVALATNATSLKFQNRFLADFSAQVVGKKISEVSLDKVSGASLTPKGFNEAVSKIKADAQG